MLLSPFWRLGTALQSLLGLLLRPFLPRYFRPLRKADLDDPKLQQSLHDFFPDVDPEDPEVRAWLRELQVPVSVISQIMKSGKQGYRSVRSVSSPVLVMQGTEDELVRPENTQMLVERLAGPDRKAADRGPRRPGGGIRYLEIPGGHNIIDRGGPAWRSVEQALIEFAHSIRDDERIRA